MRYRVLGNESLTVSSIGLGCMTVSPFYGVPNDKESIYTMHCAFDMGVNFFDTSDLYGFGHSEKIVGQAIKDKRQDIVLATKGGLIVDHSSNTPVPRGVNTTPKYIRKALDESLKRLNTDYIDLYYLHRIDPITPIEETINELKKQIQMGKIKHIGLSEAKEEEIRKAHAVHPITAIQSEYSLLFRDIESNGILNLCENLGIGVVPFSPLGRGFLAGKITGTDSLKLFDFRKSLPKFSEENIKNNYQIIEKLQWIANHKKCTIAQLALAWLLSKGTNIVPIPGISTVEHLYENINSLTIHLDRQDLEEINNICSAEVVSGEQFSKETMKIFRTYVDESFLGK